jgi:hypothetical protein
MHPNHIWGKILLSLFTFFYCYSAFAVCPLCTVAVGAGLGVSEWLGVDDTVSGLWVGALVISLSIWTVRWLKKKNVNLKWAFPLTLVFYYLLILFSLKSFIGHALNKLWGFDKLLLGITIGSILFLFGSLLSGYLKKKNNNHSYFPGQKIVIPLIPILFLSLFFYCITK